ncbi:hypothetical protein OE88DRAFT_1665174 [Heliocybe sulcata]|uniref:Uncharacterized protein n=1 Tax=Heliocybe sulcata TaxID=5364 RepID=A0A5C3MSX4_9AGAM|nr:hypothetical protein OE88DRAFT_1665174 [Heliocybe sulcata]
MRQGLVCPMRIYATAPQLDGRRPGYQDAALSPTLPEPPSNVNNANEGSLFLAATHVANLRAALPVYLSTRSALCGTTWPSPRALIGRFGVCSAAARRERKRVRSLLFRTRLGGT